MQILLGLPLGAIEELTVTFITTGHGVGSFGHLELGRLLEDRSSISAAEVGLVVLLGAQIARPGRRLEIVLGLVIGGRVVHCAGSIPAASNFHRHVFLFNQFGVIAESTKQSTRDKSSITHTDFSEL